MVLIQTLFPLPVAPAIKRWGIFAKSATIGFPRHLYLNRKPILMLFAASVPKARGLSNKIHISCQIKFQIPIKPRPGIGACTLIDFALIAKAKSSAKEVKRLTLMPLAGSSSYWVII